MYRDFVMGPGGDYEVEMRWKIEVVVNMTKSRAAEFRRSLEGFISEWQIKRQ